ncbi:MAG: hypothetical protein R2719_14980 [Micropruina sp.]
MLQGYMTEATYVDGYVTAPGFRGIVAQARSTTATSSRMSASVWSS